MIQTPKGRSRILLGGVVCHVTDFDFSSYVFQEETGEGGTSHLQGYVSFTNQIAFTTLKQWNPRLHLERAISAAASILYCSDVNKRTGRVWSNNIQGVQGSTKVLELDQLHGWQQQLWTELNGPADDRRIVWITDVLGGKGKTAFCKFVLHHKKNVVFLSTSSTKDACHVVMSQKNPPQIVLMNLPRQSEGKISYAAVETIKDGLIYSGKYTGGFRIFNPPHFIVFANWSPDFTALSIDRWHEVILRERE